MINSIESSLYVYDTIKSKGGDIMDMLKNGRSFFCGALVWFATALVCFTSPTPVFKPENNIFWGFVSLIASVVFFINGYKRNKKP
ncbi:hypothetical protein [Paraclostridium sordellii]|uniref:hypothetical protein n=1 Tax=Paraclostridium sordellii TaxID=1505 RepID=UPI0012ED73DE|nr:hypothetical protein [Paeniclostridium sordellii]